MEGESGIGNGEWGMGNGEWGMGNGEWGSSGRGEIAGRWEGVCFPLNIRAAALPCTAGRAWSVAARATAVGRRSACIRPIHEACS
ncbi:hypothetical protein EIP98_18595 [Xanthomonas campestris pv. raphani]